MNPERRWAARTPCWLLSNRVLGKKERLLGDFSSMTDHFFRLPKHFLNRSQATGLSGRNGPLPGSCRPCSAPPSFLLQQLGDAAHFLKIKSTRPMEAGRRINDSLKKFIAPFLPG